MTDATTLADRAKELSMQSAALAEQLENLPVGTHGVDPFVFALTVFVLACFVGYYVVWKVTPALHTPLMSVTNAISGIIIVGAIVALGAGTSDVSSFAGFAAIVLASINIFGGFVVTYRMLAMFQKKTPNNPN
jgi:H+-translocating NAD(P) transhydrogenase subunit alpha